MKQRGTPFESVKRSMVR